MADSRRIEPRTLKGFRDYLPSAMLAREHVVDTARSVYRSFGFVPIDTPALEYAEILLGKGGSETDKQLFRFEDHGGRDVGLRFDLTIPLARFVAQHSSELGMPFKRYHVGTVWRGEKPQRGRYREFLQCDFDTIGTMSALADAETALVIHEVLARLGFERFTLRLNHRGLLNGLLEGVGLAESAGAVLRALDKLSKVGPDVVSAELMSEAGASASQAEAILETSRLRGPVAEILPRVEAGLSVPGAAGAAALADIDAYLAAAGVPTSRVVLDLSIARGLDYYTGTVFETFLDDLPAIGSVCSGGRYDDLASVYTKETLPGVGASLGVDRLLAAMEELGLVSQRGTAADVFLPLFVAERAGDYLALASQLRGAGLSVELYPDPRKLGVQLRYADRRGHRFAIVIGDNEWSAGTCQVKDLTGGEDRVLPRVELAVALLRTLTRS